MSSQIDELQAEIRRLKGQLAIRDKQAKADSEMYRANLQHYEEACEHNFYLALKDSTEGSSEYLDKVRKHRQYRNNQLERLLKKSLSNLGAICMTDGQFLTLDEYKGWANDIRGVLQQLQKDRDATKNL